MQSQFIQERNKLYEKLQNIKGIQVYPSSTNFFLCELEKPRDFVYRELLKRGILTRTIGDDILKNALRFCIGTPEQNQYLVSCLKEILN